MICDILESVEEDRKHSLSSKICVNEKTEERSAERWTDSENIVKWVINDRWKDRWQYWWMMDKVLKRGDDDVLRTILKGGQEAQAIMEDWKRHFQLTHSGDYRSEKFKWWLGAILVKPPVRPDIFAIDWSYDRISHGIILTTWTDFKRSRELRPLERWIKSRLLVNWDLKEVLQRMVKTMGKSTK